MAEVRHSQIEQLEFGHNAALLHGACKTANRIGAIHRRLSRKVHGAQRERRHIGMSIKHRRALRQLAYGTTARRATDDDARTCCANCSKERGIALTFPSGRLVGVADMEM